MSPKKVTKKAPKTAEKSKSGKRGLYGCLKGKIHYQDDSIFNLGK